MMNTNLLAVLTPLSIYHGWSTWKKFWGGKFTGEEKFTLAEFSAVNMKSFGRQNVRKHREIKESDKYTTLDISLKFGSLDKTRITSSDPKDNLGRLGKGLITSLGLKDKSRKKKYKKAKYTIGNVSMKDISKIIREFEKLPYKVMRWVGPNMSPLTVTFTYQDSLLSVWLVLITSTCMFNL